MKRGAVYSRRFAGANIVERIQSANRCDRLHINFVSIILSFHRIDIG